MVATAKRMGIREFRNSATQVIREVRETGAEIVITVDGEPVAVVRPFTSVDEAAERKRANDEIWRRLNALSAEISAGWPEGLSAAEAVSEQRR